MQRHYAFFAPRHRVAGPLCMTDFAWLTEDRWVQRTQFGDRMEMVANFGPHPFDYDDHSIPPRSILARDRQSNDVAVYTPNPGRSS